jgi:hypothetical protein
MHDNDNEIFTISLPQRTAEIEAWAKVNLSFDQAIRLFAIHKAVCEKLLDDAEFHNRTTEQQLAEIGEKIGEREEIVDALNDSLKLNMALPTMLEEAHRNAFMKGKSAIPRRNAMKRHAGNHADKAKVFAWCDENISRFKSMDDAAFDIAENLVDQKFRAVREWMTEWKKLRSASTP